MTKGQLIQIAKAGYPELTQRTIKFKEVEMQNRGGVYRLYHKDIPFILTIPEVSELAVIIYDNDNIQFTVPYNRAFNHYGAIKEMVKLGLIREVLND